MTAGTVLGPRASAGGGHGRWSGAPGGPPYVFKCSARKPIRHRVGDNLLDLWSDDFHIEEL